MLMQLITLHRLLNVAIAKKGKEKREKFPLLNLQRFMLFHM